MLGPEARNRDPMPFEPCRRLVVEELKPARVTDDVAADPAESPGDHRRERKNDEDRREDAHRKSQEPWQPRLQPQLKGPDDRDDEQSERQRREDGTPEIEGGDQEDCRAKADHRAEPAIARRACSLEEIAHRV